MVWLSLNHGAIGGGHGEEASGAQLGGRVNALAWVFAGLGVATMALVCAAAFRFGDALTRRAAAWIIAGWLSTPFLQVCAGGVDPVLLFLAVDLIVLAAFLQLTWRSRRRWPYAAVACQGLGVATHLVRLFAPGLHLHRWAYLNALALVAYGLLAALAAGTWRAWRSRPRLISIESAAIGTYS